MPIIVSDSGYIPWSDLYPLVSQHCPGGPSGAYEFWLREAAIDFCRRTLAHQATLASFDTEIGVAAYALEPGAGLAVAKLLACRVNGTRIDLVTPAGLDGEVEVPNEGWPEAAHMTGLNELTLTPAPSSVLPVVARVALEPTRSATTINSDIAQQYGAAIAAGAAALLALTPDRRDETLASTCKAIFETEIGRALAATYFNRARSSRRSTPQWV